MLDELIRPIPARRALPDWLRTTTRAAFSEAHGREVRAVKHCPPFVDAMAHGFIIPLPCDIHARDGVLSWDRDHPVLSVDAPDMRAYLAMSQEGDPAALADQPAAKETIASAGAESLVSKSVDA